LLVSVDQTVKQFASRSLRNLTLYYPTRRTPLPGQILESVSLIQKLVCSNSASGLYSGSDPFDLGRITAYPYSDFPQPLQPIAKIRPRPFPPTPIHYRLTIRFCILSDANSDVNGTLSAWARNVNYYTPQSVEINDYRIRIKYTVQCCPLNCHRAPLPMSYSVSWFST
jgi:hypothetical protein